MLCVALAYCSALSADAEIIGCVAFKNKNFEGTKLELAPNTLKESLEGTWDDAISSVQVARGCLFVAFKDKGFRGLTQTFGPGDYSALPEGWDDQISSLRCNCRSVQP